MVKPQVILVTGSAGRIGRGTVKELACHGHRVRGFDRVATPGTDDLIVGDIANPADVARAMQGVESLIHLAATPDDDDFLTQLLPNNIVGLYHILEAAREAGVRRLFLASSGQVMWHRRRGGPWPIHVDDPPTPRGWYSATKLFLEAAGRAYATSNNSRVVAVRLGWCPRTKAQEDELAASIPEQDVYLSPGDAGRFFAAAVQVPITSDFDIVFATSRHLKLQRFDLEPAKRLFGYEPQDHWPIGTGVESAS